MKRRHAAWASVAVVLATGAAGAPARAWVGICTAAPVCEAEAGPISVVPEAWVEHPPNDPPAAAAAPFCPPPPEPSERLAGAPSVELVRRAWRLVGELEAEGRFEEALLQLRVVEAALPEIADRLALRRAELSLRVGRVRAALRSFERAERSLDSSVRVRAQVRRVEAMLRRGEPGALEAFRRLRARYPRLSREAELWLAHAEHLREAGRPVHAGYVYRRVLRDFPVGPAARRAAEAIEALRAEGARIAPLKPEERLDRIDRLLASGARAEARREVDRLLEAGDLAEADEARLRLLAARLARWRSDWAAMRRHLERARRLAARLAARGETLQVPASLEEVAAAARLRDRERAAARLERLRGGRPWEKLPSFRLLRAVPVAAAAGLEEPLRAIVGELQRRPLPARLRLDAVLSAVGVVPDAAVAEWLEPLAGATRRGIPARYHRARALERLGRWQQAEAEYARVVAAGGYYALWARQRIEAVRRGAIGGEEPAALLAAVEREALGFDRPGRMPRRWADRAPLKPLALAERTGPATRRDAGAPLPLVPQELPEVREDEALLGWARGELLDLAAEHGEAFPWLARAAALLALGEREAAGDELHEALLAWRAATGRPIAFAGLESIYRGGPRRRPRASWPLRRARAALPAEARRRLGEVADRLGEVGVAAGFLGGDYVQRRPRPYEREVVAAASRHGLDPALLWAVMRVESVYQRRIVSYAGAIGLMQIMPATGRAIAWQRGRTDFVPEQLLDPALNLDFAAWYLRSLLDRFEGRLPLAIAAYNGGPHNVRRWMAERPASMPLDAWLEHVPFGQTWRYVRRVLGHYEAYREQLGLPMPRLPVTLPEERADTIGF